MNSRFAPIFLALALAVPPCSFAGSGAQAKTVLAKNDAGNENEARSLRLTEMKLAALVKEAKGEPNEVKGPVAKKKQAGSGHKKRHSTARLKAKGDRKAQKIVGRRLTMAEVRGVLTTTRDFTGSDLSGMNLVGVDLSGVKFNRANLHLANLERADLAESDLELADLTGANLRGASLNQARLRGTRLAGTRMEGALWVDRTICKKGSVGDCIE